MLGPVRGCLRIMIVVMALIILGVLGYANRDELRSMWNELSGSEPAAEAVPSQALADEAQAKLDDLREGRIASASFNGAELQSLLMYEYQGLLPAFLDSPRVQIEDSRIIVTGRMPIDRLPDVDGMRQAAALLPDTTDLALKAQVLPLGSGRVALAVDDITVSRIPLPERLYAPALARLGRRDEAGLPPDALALPLPPGATNAWVRGDSLVLTGKSADSGS